MNGVNIPIFILMSILTAVCPNPTGVLEGKTDGVELLNRLPPKPVD